MTMRFNDQGEAAMVAGSPSISAHQLRGSPAVRPVATGVVLFAAAAILAFALYRPDIDAPFEIVDFSETLPLLNSGGGFLERTEVLIRYYLSQGRAAILLSAGLAAKWTVFGAWTPGWQWTRFAVLLAAIVLIWRLLRVLGANRSGATAGAALFIVSETVAPGWLRPAVNEPFGLLLLVIASLLGTRYQSSPRPLLRGAGIAGLLALALLAKETLIAAAWLPLIIACCRDDEGRLTYPRASRRNLQLLALAAAALLIVAVVVLWASTQAAATGYTRQFDFANASLSNAVFGLIPAIFPFTPVPTPPGLISLAAVLAWLAVLVIGWRYAPTAARARRHARILLAVGLALPITRVLVYLPWPLQYSFYSIPYLLGPAILFAMAVTWLIEAARPARVLAYAALVVIVAYSASVSAAETSRQFASRRLTNALVTALHELRTTLDPAARIVTAVPRLKEQEWWGLGPTLTRYGNATGRELPAIADMPCDVARTEMVQHADRTVFVSLRWQCLLSGVPSQRIHTVTERFEANRLRWSSDTLWADIFASSQQGR